MTNIDPKTYRKSNPNRDGTYHYIPDERLQALTDKAEQAIKKLEKEIAAVKKEAEHDGLGFEDSEEDLNYIMGLEYGVELLKGINDGS